MLNSTVRTLALCVSVVTSQNVSKIFMVTEDTVLNYLLDSIRVVAVLRTSVTC